MIEVKKQTHNQDGIFSIDHLIKLPFKDFLFTNIYIYSLCEWLNFYSKSKVLLYCHIFLTWKCNMYVTVWLQKTNLNKKLKWVYYSFIFVYEMVFFFHYIRVSLNILKAIPFKHITPHGKLFQNGCYKMGSSKCLVKILKHRT